MIQTNINLTEYQTKNLLDAYKKHMLVKIRLTYKQIVGKAKHKILLNDTQKKNFDKSIKLQKGLDLQLDYEKIRINRKGGPLPLIFVAHPEIITAIEGLAGGGGAAIAFSVINAKHTSAEEAETKRHNMEMEKIAKEKRSLSTGSGLKIKNH